MPLPRFLSEFRPIRLFPLAILAALATPAFAQPVQLDVASATLSRDVGGTVRMRLVLTPPSAAAFAIFTAANVGNRVELRLDGTPVLAATVRDPITGGEVMIAGGFTPAELGAIADRIAAGGVRVEAEVIAP